MNCGKLGGLFEQYFALVDLTVRLPTGTDRRSAFRDVRDFGSRIDRIAARLLERGPIRTAFIRSAAIANSFWILQSAYISALGQKRPWNGWSRQVGCGPCVDGSGLARVFFTHAAVVGAAMCSAC